MVRIGIAILGAIVGGVAATVVIIFGFGLETTTDGQATHIDPTRSDYVDLLLTLATIFLGAIGLAVTVGALVIGLVALKTLREIKDDAAEAAKVAAGNKIGETMATELEPNVTARVSEALPMALRTALLSDEIGHQIMREMAESGELDEVLERVAMRMQGGGPEPDPEGEGQYGDG